VSSAHASSADLGAVELGSADLGSAHARSGAVVAVDIGGTTLKGALVGPEGQLLHRQDLPTPAAEGGTAVTTAVIDLVQKLVSKHHPGQICGVAAVTPGRVESGVVHYAANLGWKDVRLARILAETTGLPAAVDNDVNAAALAESVQAGRNGECLFVALGTGVGAAHARDGRVHPGSTGAAGELGHIPVHPEGQLCACGQRGCLEAYASASAVARRYAAAAGLPAVGGAAAVESRLGSDPLADQVWAEAVEALALALATATMLLDPALIVLGGGLAGAGKLLLDPLGERLAARLTWRTPPPVQLSTLGNDAGWRGAAMLAWRAGQEKVR
jgi:glucokinase